MSVSAEHCKLMAAVGKFADEAWAENGRFIAGDLGFESVHLAGVEMSHPPLPIFAYYLGLLPVASNGAMVSLWGSPDPLCICLLNVNHSQTRKSRLTAQAESMCARIDEVCGKVLNDVWGAKLKVAANVNAAKRRKLSADGGEVAECGDDDDEKMIAFPGAFSVAFLGGTIERVRERCAGDCPSVRQTKVVQKLPSLRADNINQDCPGLNAAEKEMAIKPGMQGRVWFGQGLLYDEVYQVLQDISILEKPSEKRSSDGPGSGQTPLAGWFNRLVQSGKSDHETKCNGSHGGLACPPVSVSLLGNFHPTPAIEMLRGDRGDHGCQAKARLIIVTGMPVQPHEHYEDVGSLTCQADWFPIPREIHAAVGLGNACDNVHVFKEFFEGNLFADGEPDDADDADPQTHLPDATGYQHILPDGVHIRVRMTLVNGRYRSEWRLPNRKVDIPDDRNISLRMPGFVHRCAQTPHRQIGLTPDARGAFLSYATMYNIKVKTARDSDDADAGAEWGIAPWKLGMLSASLLLWDILWGVVKPLYKEAPWEVQLYTYAYIYIYIYIRCIYIYIYIYIYICNSNNSNDAYYDDNDYYYH